MINCYVVDDEIASVEILCDYIDQTNGLCIQRATTRPHDVLDLVSHSYTPQITFLDIDMPGINGLELAGLIGQYTAIIFVTAHPEYAREAFEMDAYDFLVKPVSYPRFLHSVMKVRSRLPQTAVPTAENLYFFFKGGNKGQIIKSAWSDLLYVEGMANYVRLHTANGTFTAYLTIKEIDSKLNKYGFVRIHKSCVINLNKIKMLEGNLVHMENGDVLTVGLSYRQNLLLEMKNKMLLSMRRSGAPPVKPF